MSKPLCPLDNLKSEATYVIAESFISFQEYGIDLRLPCKCLYVQCWPKMQKMETHRNLAVVTERVQQRKKTKPGKM